MNEESERPDMMEISESIKMSERGGGKGRLVEDEEVNSPAKIVDPYQGLQQDAEGDRFVPEKVMEVQEGGGSGSEEVTVRCPG